MKTTDYDPGDFISGRLQGKEVEFVVMATAINRIYSTFDREFYELELYADKGKKVHVRHFDLKQKRWRDLGELDVD